MTGIAHITLKPPTSNTFRGKQVQPISTNDTNKRNFGSGTPVVRVAGEFRFTFVNQNLVSVLLWLVSESKVVFFTRESNQSAVTLSKSANVLSERRLY